MADIYDYIGNVIDVGGGGSSDTSQYQSILDVRSKSYGQTNLPTTANNNVLTLLHFSDIHGDLDRLREIVRFRNQYSQFINDVISTGDNVYDIYSDWNWNQVPGAENILNCIGNHDVADKNGTTYIWDSRTEAQAYQSQFKDMIANWGVVYSENKCYYYKDYTSQGIRLIVLDATHISETQTAWITATLESARQNNLAVVIAKHGGHNSTPIDCTFEFDKTNYNFGNDYNYASVVELVDTFINNGGTFICYLCGHWHRDFVRVAENNHNQLEIGISCAVAYPLWYMSDHYRVIGTKSEHLFNLVSIEKASGLIKILRIGADEDVKMQHQHSLCYDFVNHKLISNY